MENPFESICQRLTQLESLNGQILTLLSDGRLPTDLPTASTRPMTIEEVAELTLSVVSTVRGWLKKRIIPHHKMGKRLLFFENEILAWIKNGRRLTGDELAIKAAQTITRPGRKGGRHGK